MGENWERARDAEYGSHDWIETFTGRRFSPMAPRAKDLTIFDMAHATSQMCRYNGHTRDFYSSGEHGLNLAFASARAGFGAEVQLEFLVHDFTDAYFPDIPKPIKHHFPNFVEAELHLYGLIREHAGLRGPIPGVVKEWDARILRDERKALMFPTGNVWGIDDLKPLGILPNSGLPTYEIENLIVKTWTILTTHTHGRTTFVDFRDFPTAVDDRLSGSKRGELPIVLDDVSCADVLGACSLWKRTTVNVDRSTSVQHRFEHGPVKALL